MVFDFDFCEYGVSGYKRNINIRLNKTIVFHVGVELNKLVLPRQILMQKTYFVHFIFFENILLYIFSMTEHVRVNLISLMCTNIVRIRVN